MALSLKFYAKVRYFLSSACSATEAISKRTGLMIEGAEPRRGKKVDGTISGRSAGRLLRQVQLSGLSFLDTNATSS